VERKDREGKKIMTEQDLVETCEKRNRAESIINALCPGIIGSYLTLGLGIYESISRNPDAANVLCGAGIAGGTLLLGLLYQYDSKELKRNTVRGLIDETIRGDAR
jgi:hypothetical protein